MPRRILKWAFRFVEALFVLTIIYFIVAFTLPYISVNADFKPCKKDGTVIYLLTNGVHTDFVFPLKNKQKDWSKNINPSNTKSGCAFAKYISFGWGDKAFYLKTPEWSDLTFETAFNAVFHLGNAAIHVNFYDTVQENKSCKRISINRETYQKLITYIEAGFDRDNTGNFVLIKGASYSDNDLFYEAKGAYSLFFTCNTWTNSGLKAASMKACLWTPFKNGIFYQYRK